MTKVLMAHNHYLRPGGEDAVFGAEKALLERMGHEVITFVEDNARLRGMNPLKAAGNAIWSKEIREKLQALIQETKPDVVHFHNTFLMISPAGYYTCKDAGVPVVQTLHNYRLICPGALLMRDGQVCEDCLGKTPPWPSVVHGCWRGSRVQTAVVAAMLTAHRWRKTWTEQVDWYIALTDFARHKFIEGGFPAGKMVVKPNFVYPDPGMGTHDGGYALFVGRLSPEKGVQTLLHAWQRLDGIPLKIVGDGPLQDRVIRFIVDKALTEVEFLGRRPRNDVFRLMKAARVLISPSRCYEGFPVTIAEAFACGTPVIASNLGSLAEIVQDQYSGLHFMPSDSEDLAAKVEWAWNHPDEITAMGRNARKDYEEKYTAERNYEMLMGIYERSIAN